MGKSTRMSALRTRATKIEMNRQDCPALSVRQVIFLVALLSALLWSGRVSAQTLTNQYGPSNRWLIVFDISRGMESKAEAVQEIATGFVQSGANGQMRRGDTLGIWLFNENLFVGKFPLQEWRPESAHEIAHRLVGFLQTVPYEKDAHLENVTPDLMRIIKGSDFITTIILSDGSSEISGTDCDAKINSSFREWRKAQQKAKMPFITVLRAARGTITDCTITTPPFPLELPRPSPELLALRKPPVPKGQPAPIGAPLIVSGRTTPPLSGENIIVKGNKADQPEPPPTDPSAQITSAPAPGNSDPAPTPSTTQPDSAPLSTELSVLARPSETPSPNANSDATPAQSPSTVAKSTETTTTPATTGGYSTGALPVQNAVASVPQPLYLQKHVLIGAGGAMVLLLFVVAMLSRRRSRGQERISLITRSLDKEQKPK